MKKYGIAIVFCLCFLLSGCSSKYDDAAIQAFGDALISLQNNSSMNMDIKILGYEDAKQERLMAKMTMQGTVVKQENDVQMSLAATVAANGLSLGKINFYLKDANLYMDVLGTKGKLPFDQVIPDFNQMAAQQNDIPQANVEAAIKEAMKEFRYRDQEAGIITFSFQDSFIREQMNQNLAADAATIQHFDGTLTIKDNQITAYSFLLDLQTEEQPMTMAITIECSDFDQTAEIAFPDFSDYIEQDNFDITE